MKQPEEIKRRIVSEWLNKADTDFNLADHLLSEGALFPDAIAFHAQQAAEKFLKAYLTFHQSAFPKTHDLEELLNIIEEIDSSFACSLHDIIILTFYGVEVRYPGDRPEVTPEEAREATELARKVHDAVHKVLSIDFI